MKTRIVPLLVTSYLAAAWRGFFAAAASIVLAAGANAQNSPPVAIDDFYGVDQLAALNELAPGVLVNDSDPDVSNTLTAASARKVIPAQFGRLVHVCACGRLLRP